MWDSDLDGAIGSGGSFSTSNLSVGTHAITAAVTDSGGGLVGSDTITVTVHLEGVVTLDIPVSASSDDAEERVTGSVTLTSGDLELVFDKSGNQTVGLRFNTVGIPLAASIVNASVQFQVDELNSEVTSLTIEGEATDNAGTFSNSTGNISTRSRTASFETVASIPGSPEQTCIV